MSEIKKQKRHQMHVAELRRRIAGITGAFLARINAVRDFEMGIQGAQAIGSAFCAYILGLSRCLAPEKRLEFCQHFLKAISESVEIQLKQELEKSVNG